MYGEEATLLISMSSTTASVSTTLIDGEEGCDVPEQRSDGTVSSSRELRHMLVNFKVKVIMKSGQ